ncbi:MAG: DotI/IcmL family type IV secretion protein, partial [Gammaproteobacteria bacterium]
AQPAPAAAPATPTTTTVAVQPAPAAAPATPTTTTVAAQPAPAAPATTQTTTTVTAQPAPVAAVATQTTVVTVPKVNIDCSYHLPSTTVSEQELTQWAQNAVIKSFDFSFDKLDEQLQTLKSCFTDPGWHGFNEALQQSGNLSIIKNQKLTVSGHLSGQAVVHTTKENSWQIIVPIDVVYQNTQEKFTQSLAVTLVVTKKTAEELGIVQLIATVNETASAS